MADLSAGLETRIIPRSTITGIPINDIKLTINSKHLKI